MHDNSKVKPKASASLEIKQMLSYLNIFNIHTMFVPELARLCCSASHFRFVVATETPIARALLPMRKSLRNAFWFPSARPFVSKGAKISLFLNERFLTSLVVYRSALPCGFIFLAPARFGDLELTRTKKNASLTGRALFRTRMKR